MNRTAKWLLAISVVLLVAVALIAFITTYAVRRAEPKIREALVAELQRRFRGQVQLATFKVTTVNGIYVDATGLRIWLPDDLRARERSDPDAPLAMGVGKQPDRAWIEEPWITVDHLSFHATWDFNVDKPIDIGAIEVQGVRVLLPPREERKAMGPGMGFAGQNAAEAGVPAGAGGGSEAGVANGKPASQNGSHQKKTGMKLPPVAIGRIECNDAQLLILRRQNDPGKPPKVPLDFLFSKAVLTPDGHGGPIAFDIFLTNAKPVGAIHSVGHAGPWQGGDPRDLAVDGTYSFDHADLSTIKGIAGILSSTGKYTGTLGKIQADGSTQTPDFRLERVSDAPGIPLTTHFHAIVDGTNGDTYLQPVDAMLGRTHILAQGQVVRSDDGKGHDIRLQVAIDHGRIEDILRISATPAKPMLVGNLVMKTQFHLPHGDVPVMQKLELQGKFHLSQAQFSSDKIQGGLRQLSLRGQGKPKEIKSTDIDDIYSEAQGHFTLGGGKLQLPDLTYTVPGAAILVKGVYGMTDGSLSFQGNARMDATISKMVGGWKGALLKPIDPLLHKNGAGADVPIHLTGNRKAPEFGVEFGRVGKEDTVPSQPDETAPPKGAQH